MNKGFTLLETLIVFALISIALPIFYNLANYGVDLSKQKNAARSLELVSQATTKYLQNNIEALRSSSTESSGLEISITELKAENLLPHNFNPKNVYGQDYRIFFRKENDNILGIVLSYNGIEVNDKFANITIPSVAAQLVSGGYIPTGQLPDQSPNTLYGNAGTYAIDLSSKGIPNPNIGHLGSVTMFDTNNLSQDFLYRYSIPNKEELNTMYTELFMDNNAISDVGSLAFTNEDISTKTCTIDNEGQIIYDNNQGLYICRENKFELIQDTKNSLNLRDLSFSKNYDFVTKPICQEGKSPKIYLSPSILAAGAISPSIVAFQSWAEEFDPNTWQIFLRVLTSDNKQSWIFPTEDYARLLVFTTCQ